MAAKVFISYRRDDSRYQARMIHAAFCRTIPRDHVFMDIDSIPPGANFRKILNEWVGQCDLLLALIGPGWMDATDAKTGQRRLDDPRDFVRIEISEALARAIPVVPVLIDGAPLPDSDLLPEDLRGLVDYQAQVVEYRSFDADIEGLIRKLALSRDQKDGSLRATMATRARNLTGLLAVRRRWAGLAVVAASAVLVAGYLMRDQFGAKVQPRVGAPFRAQTPDIIAPQAPRTGDATAVATPNANEGERKPDQAAPLSPDRERALKPKETFVECSGCPEMVAIPAGEFLMGSKPSDIAVLAKEQSFWENVFKSEDPQHKVVIRRPFAVGRFAVTFAEWDACLADGGCNGYRPKDEGWGRVTRPVINVSWDDAKAYAEWVSRKTGKTYRLLSEAEREYVTRAGTTTAFWWGSSISISQANYEGTPDGLKGRMKTVPVDSFEPNPWGLYDVHGNVSEWTADCWHDDYQGAPSDGSAWTTACNDQEERVTRGGSWGSQSFNVRAASRAARSNTDQKAWFFGFRLARTLNP
jgi:formylglycine-generating enzyme required for sulfatase activity